MIMQNYYNILNGGSGNDADEQQQHQQQHQQSPLLSLGDYPSLMQQYLLEQQIQRQQQISGIPTTGSNGMLQGLSGLNYDAVNRISSGNLAGSSHLQHQFQIPQQRHMSTTTAASLMNASWDTQPASAQGREAPLSLSSHSSSRFEYGNTTANTSSSDMFAQQGLLGPWSATSASLLGSMVCYGENGELKRKVNRKKDKNKPKRPLSAYNIFFKEERARLLMDKDGNPIRPEGKEAFENLAKLIGQRWKNLREEESETYKEKAAIDMNRYKKEMEVYNNKSRPIVSEDSSSSLGLSAASMSQPAAKKQKTDG